MQIADVQSVFTVQALPFTQVLPAATQVDPPQSVAVSVPFFTVSVQVAALHRLPVQTPVTQSAAIKQALLTGQVFDAEDTQLPPQSAAVSVPFLTPSVQVTGWQMFPVHTPLAQSAARLQALPAAHLVEHEPPQSVSVSAPFLTRSVQIGAMHFPEVQTPLTQSEATLHALAVAQAVAQVEPVAKTPPQSTSVSVPFLTLSGHLGATHLRLVHTPEAQSVARVQALVVAQREQLVDPPQSTSLSPWFFVTSEQDGD